MSTKFLGFCSLGLSVFFICEDDLNKEVIQGEEGDSRGGYMGNYD